MLCYLIRIGQYTVCRRACSARKTDPTLLAPCHQVTWSLSDFCGGCQRQKFFCVTAIPRGPRPTTLGYTKVFECICVYVCVCVCECMCVCVCTSEWVSELNQKTWPCRSLYHVFRWMEAYSKVQEKYGTEAFLMAVCFHVRMHGQYCLTNTYIMRKIHIWSNSIVCPNRNTTNINRGVS